MTTSCGICKFILAPLLSASVTASWQSTKNIALSVSRLTANCTHSSLEKGFLLGKPKLPPPSAWYSTRRVLLRVEEMICRRGEDAEDSERRVALEPAAWRPTRWTPMPLWSLECRRWEYSLGRIRCGARGRILYAARAEGYCRRDTPLMWWDVFKCARRSIAGEERRQRFWVGTYRSILADSGWHVVSGVASLSSAGHTAALLESGTITTGQDEVGPIFRFSVLDGSFLYSLRGFWKKLFKIFFCGK